MAAVGTHGDGVERRRQQRAVERNVHSFAQVSHDALGWDSERCHVHARALLRGLGIGVAVAPAVLLRRHRLFAQSSTQYSSRAVTLMRESIVIDLLNQFMRPHRNSMPPKIEQWLSRPETFTDAEAAVFVESGIRVFALGGGSGAPIFNYNNLISGSGGRLLRIDSISDIERAQRERHSPDAAGPAPAVSDCPAHIEVLVFVGAVMSMSRQ